MPTRQLLLLHGALGAASQLEPLKGILQDNFEVFTPDLPGHGGRAIPGEPFSFSLFAADLLRLLDEKNVAAINIFGYSMGGYAALWLANKFPGRVGKIFTLATKMDWNEATARREASMLDPDQMQEKIPAFAKMLEQRHAPQDWKQIVKKTAGMMLVLEKDHLTDDDFRKIKHETMITTGDQDSMVSIEESKHVAELLPNGSCYIFPGTRHPFEKVDLNKLAEQIRIFIK